VHVGVQCGLHQAHRGVDDRESAPVDPDRLQRGDVLEVQAASKWCALGLGVEVQEHGIRTQPQDKPLQLLGVGMCQHQECRGTHARSFPEANVEQFART